MINKYKDAATFLLQQEAYEIICNYVDRQDDNIIDNMICKSNFVHRLAIHMSKYVNDNIHSMTHDMTINFKK